VLFYCVPPLAGGIFLICGRVLITNYKLRMWWNFSPWVQAY